MLGFTSPLDTFSMLNMFVWEKSGDFSFLGLLKSDINKIIKVKFWNDVGTAVGLILDQTKAQSIYTPESTYLVELRMFALLSGLWKYLFQKDEYCILILGLDNAGKSVSWDGFIFGLTITYVPLCGGYDPVSQFFRKLLAFWRWTTSVDRLDQPFQNFSTGTFNHSMSRPLISYPPYISIVSSKERRTWCISLADHM